MPEKIETDRDYFMVDALKIKDRLGLPNNCNFDNAEKSVKSLFGINSSRYSGYLSVSHVEARTSSVYIFEMTYGF